LGGAWARGPGLRETFAARVARTSRGVSREFPRPPNRPAPAAPRGDILRRHGPFKRLQGMKRTIAALLCALIYLASVVLSRDVQGSDSHGGLDVGDDKVSNAARLRHEISHVIVTCTLPVPYKISNPLASMIPVSRSPRRRPPRHRLSTSAAQFVTRARSPASLVRHCPHPHHHRCKLSPSRSMFPSCSTRVARGS